MELQNHQDQNLRQHSGKSLEDDAITMMLLEKKSILTHYGESLTISDTFHRPTIRSLVKSHGNDYMMVFVTGLLHEFLSFVPNGLNADEIVLYAEKILAHCPTWTTADLILCFKNGIDGKYGVVKYHWKWNVFIEWQQRYDQEKEDFFYQKHQKVKNEERVDVLKYVPKEILEKFTKVTGADKNEKSLEYFKVPDDIISQGVKAVDEWIEKCKKKK